ncbi:molecular chaperone GrpE (heat shock protein) [Xenococcus sp. PCC 7305]|uniref:nucleotide exchange factor GrpE n=1 Tax=Xenococcus sp. PCC 7305 TaxID=102125 RepID=UPI0002AC05F9|nr:nucleotide exchange factor GrpE [Xenococcus sp. PCC 7305]ELS01582.1 molecular chaperone GrpE (heat shock protein) [Xenococcus sp. PCC 7305]
MSDDQKQQEQTIEEQDAISSLNSEKAASNTVSEENSALDSAVATSESEIPELPELSEIPDIPKEVEAISPEQDTATETESENEKIIAILQQENANLKKLFDDQVKQSNITKSQYARLAADFDNFRKRTIKEKENLERQSKKDIINKLLPVVDNFERARVQIKPNNEAEKTIQNSYQGVYKTLVDCLKRMGVSAMRPEGQEFDPNFHEAMLREPSNEYPEGTVIEQLMRGYMLEDQVLRHAMVKVAVPQEPMITSEEKQDVLEDVADNAESIS